MFSSEISADSVESQSYRFPFAEMEFTAAESVRLNRRTIFTKTIVDYIEWIKCPSKVYFTCAYKVSKRLQ